MLTHLTSKRGVESPIEERIYHPLCWLVVQYPTLFGASAIWASIWGLRLCFWTEQERPFFKTFFKTQSEVQLVSCDVKLFLSSGFFPQVSGSSENPFLKFGSSEIAKGPRTAEISRRGWLEVVPNTLKTFQNRDVVAVAGKTTKPNRNGWPKKRAETFPSPPAHNNSAVQVLGLPVSRSDQGLWVLGPCPTSPVQSWTCHLYCAC